MFNGPVIDLHCHLLPGIDDGPASLEGSLALARAAVAAGTEAIVATPHVSPRYPNDADTIHRLVERTADYLEREGVSLEVLPGAEIAITRLAEMGPEQIDGLRLGTGPWLLLEPPFTAVVTGLDTMVMDLLGRGRRVFLAHPERCPAFHRDPGMLESLVEQGVLTSLTAGSLVGRFGGKVRRFSLELMEAEMVHNVASDAHDERSRPPGIAQELERAGYGALRDWLTWDVPSAVVTGREIPTRPAVGRARTAASRLPWRRRG
jgi:protein-tyrosine phosphatase